ncbi:MAG: sigma-70 family RNA polymerase sigma factor [Planctomyces sp.]|nr:sigma-70 family RNA polymerase sigma factor [Planctomyces sp.]
MNGPPRNDNGNDMQPQPGLEEMFERFRPRLRSLIELRIDRRIRARIDPSDVIQEAFTDAVRRFPDYRREGGMPPYLWLRFLTLQQLLIAHRKHLSVKARSAAVESPLDMIRAMSVETDSVVESLLGTESSPSAKAVRNEELQQLAVSVEQMDSVDREILVLRHFEQLEFAEIAAILEMSYDAVSSRYRRSLRKLGNVLNGFRT